MKSNIIKRGVAGLLSLVMCISTFVGIGTTTAFAAGEQAEVYLVSFPRSGDTNLDYSGTWGHPNLHYLNGWNSGESKFTIVRAMHSYDGNICYCIEPGAQQDTGDKYTSKDESFWDNLPSNFNGTISPQNIKLFIGRIMQYGYTGSISTSWRSQNSKDAATLAQVMATQVLIWETVVGERDENFNHVSTGNYDAVKSSVSKDHPLYSKFISYYNSIEASVKRHSAIPSFMAKTPGKAQSVELAWNGTNYTATLTDSNKVLSEYSFSANEDRHIGDAISHRFFENVGDFFFGYAVQEAVFHTVDQIGEIVGDVVLYGISCRRLDGNGKGFLVFQLSEGTFQRVDHFCRVFVPHLPNGNSAGKAAWMRVGNIEVVDKPLAALVGILKDGNAVCATIDPSPELLVPVVDLKDGGGIRSLCVNQKLFVKAQTVVVAGRAQKRFPAFGVCNDRFAGSVIQLRNEVVFSCHRWTPPYRS